MREPLHSVIASRAEARIRSGEWTPGTRLPPERELCRILDVSRSTLRLALAELEERGLITRHQGRGTFVARRRIEADATSYFTIGAALRAGGRELDTKVVKVETSPASRTIAADLGILPGDPVVHLERLRSLDREPLLLETSNLPVALFPELGRQDLEHRSLYEILHDVYGHEPSAATETLEPVMLTPHEAAQLGVGRHTPALLIRRVSVDTAGTPIEVTQALLRGDRSRFLLQRRLGPDLPEPWPATTFGLELDGRLSAGIAP